MTERATGSQVSKIILAIDRFNAAGSHGRAWSGRRFDNSTTYRTERFIQAGSRVLTAGKLVNPHEHLDLPVVLSWEFGVDGRISDVDLYATEAEELIHA
jgi:hypothetical protein